MPHRPVNVRLQSQIQCRRENHEASAVIVSENFPAIDAGCCAARTHTLPGPRHRIVLPATSLCPGIHPTAVVHPRRSWASTHTSALRSDRRRRCHRRQSRSPLHVVIYRGATIGNNFFAHAHAVVREFCNLGDNVLLQNGVVVGSDGFGFAKLKRAMLRIKTTATAGTRSSSPAMW